jgi:Predicted dehydrogenases and related proteins
MDLGIHLIDAALWILGFPKVLNVNSRLYSQGRQLDSQSNAVEDYATAQMDTDSGVTLSMQCSWRLSVDKIASSPPNFLGTEGARLFTT